MNLMPLILEAIKNVNEDLEIEALHSVDENTLLFEHLDSLGTLDLVLELEALIDEEYGTYVAVADEHTMDATQTPFRTIVHLENYLSERIPHATS